jgi:hypothetical protein
LNIYIKRSLTDKKAGTAGFFALRCWKPDKVKITNAAPLGSSVRVQHSSVRVQRSSVRVQLNSVRVQHSSVRM